MAAHINLTGKTLVVVNEETDEIAEIPPSPDHAPIAVRLDTNSTRENADHKAVGVDGLIVDAKLHVKGLKFKPEPDVTYIIPRDAAMVLHGKIPFAAVYPAGSITTTGHTALIRLT